MTYNKLFKQLSDYSESLNLCSPISINLKQVDVKLMEKASLQVYSLLNSSQYNKYFLKNCIWANQIETPDVHSPLCMIGVDFHLTAEGPRLIEVNSNAGGLVTSSIWSHRHDKNKLKCSLSLFVESLTKEFNLLTGKKLKRLAIVDENPSKQFTYYDFLLTKSLLHEHGIICEIIDTKENLAHFDMIYNRSCDFSFIKESSSNLKKSYLNSENCITPNPFMYSRISDKRTLFTINNFISLDSINYLELKEVMLPCMHIKDFILSKNKRSGWFFKPAMEYAGIGVFRGRKISLKKFNEISTEEFIVQAEAKCATTNYEGEDFKYDIRIFVWKNQIIDLSVRTYQGRLTNFRTKNGGYASYTLE